LGAARTVAEVRVLTQIGDAPFGPSLYNHSPSARRTIWAAHYAIQCQYSVRRPVNHGRPSAFALNSSSLCDVTSAQCLVQISD
jgi:hypothetical protein